MHSLTSEVYTDAGDLVRHTVYSCSRHGLATARLMLEQPGDVIPFPKTLPCWQYAVYRSVMLHHFNCLL